MASKKATIAALAVVSFGALAAADHDIKVEDTIPEPSSNDAQINKIKAITPTDPWKPASVKIPDGSLADQFVSEADFNKNWVPSRTQKEDVPADSDEKDKDLWRYRGVWKLEEPIEIKGSGPGDLGLVIQSPAAHHAISRRLPKPVQFKGKDTITIQYEVKLQNGLECGGAYIKLLSHDEKFDPAKFSDKSPYTIMFGPDKCGATNKVHFIFRHANKKTGEIKEHHLKNPPSVPSTFTKETHLYTLLIHPESNTFEIKIDNESKQKGSLFDDFEPAVVPPKEIDDPNDKKPEDWVDDAKIPDPQATKPDDWDDSAPKEIEDPNATKPEDWLDHEQQFVPDPEAKKPEDWDDEEDGDWIAPSVPNPKCESVSGCGPWEHPKVKNPNYKGKWTAPLIDNPAYKGVWKPRKIANPDYVEDKHPGHMTPIGAVGLELWTMQDKILFDNILISDSITASQLATWTKETWTKKHEVESALIKALEPETVKADDANNVMDKAPEPLDFKAQFSPKALQKFVATMVVDPAKAVQQFPLLVGALGAVLATIFLALVSFLFGGSSSSSSSVPSPTKRKSPKQKKAESIKHESEAEDRQSGEGEEEVLPKSKSTSAKSSPSKQEIRKRVGSNKKDEDEKIKSEDD